MRRSEVIIVIDNDDAVRRAVCRMLGRGGFAALAIPDAATLIAMAERREHFDLVLSDVEMPDMNGFELIDRVRAHVPDVKVVFMSGSATHTPEGEAILSKPFTIRELIDAVLRALGTGN